MKYISKIVSGLRESGAALRAQQCCNANGAVVAMAMMRGWLDEQHNG